MYQFHHVQDGFTELLDFQLFRCAFQAQVVLSDTEFLEVEQSLFRATARGISLEILVYAPYRSLLITNALLRLADSGARVFWHKEHTQPSMLMVDKKLLFSEEELLFDNQMMALEATGMFKQRCADAVQIHAEHGKMHIDFRASADFVEPGAAVELQWNVAGADTVLLEPSIGFVTSQGSVTVYPEVDTLFRLQGSNADVQRTAVVFVKCRESAPLRLELSLYESQLGTFIPLYSPAGFDNHVAIPPNSQVRIRWHATIPGVLREAGWGSLPLYGERLTTVAQDTTLRFEYRGPTGVTTIPVRLFVEEYVAQTVERTPRYMPWLERIRKVFKEK